MGHVAEHRSICQGLAINTFVHDTCTGFLEILKSDDLFGETISIGMNEEISVTDLAKKIAEMRDRNIVVVCDDEKRRPSSSEIGRFRCNSKKLVRRTEWRPGYDLGRGLAKTIEWLSGSGHLYKSGSYNV